MTATPPAGDWPAALTLAYRVRFDESTADGVVRTSALLRYAQDAAWVHSERLGFDRRWYAERGLTWLVRSVELALTGPIATGTTLSVTTRIAGYRRAWARRRTTFAVAGRELAWAHTDWVIVDARGAPTRVPQVFSAVLAEPPGPFEPVRVSLPPTPPSAATRRDRARGAELDPLGHVNNAAYLDHVEEALRALAPDGRLSVALPRTVRLEYAAAAAAGTELVARAWVLDGGRVGVRLSTGSGTELVRAVLET